MNPSLAIPITVSIKTTFHKSYKKNTNVYGPTYERKSDVHAYKSYERASVTLNRNEREVRLHQHDLNGPLLIWHGGCRGPRGAERPVGALCPHSGPPPVTSSRKMPERFVRVWESRSFVKMTMMEVSSSWWLECAFLCLKIYVGSSTVVP